MLASHSTPTILVFFPTCERVLALQTRMLIIACGSSHVTAYWLWQTLTWCANELKHGCCLSLLSFRGQVRYVQYQFAHRRAMSVAAMAQLLGNTLYYKRFFPYYTFNLCAGLDAEGAPFEFQGRLSVEVLILSHAGSIR